MARQKGDPIAIFDGIVERLIDQIDGMTEASCYLSLNPEALPSPGPGDLLLVVAPLSGQFDEGAFEGGGNEMLTFLGGVVVRIYSPLKVDLPGHDSKFLSDQTKGVLEMGRQVMAALSNWSPELDDNEQTRDPLIPHGVSYGRVKQSLGWMEIAFKVNFDWNLDPAEE